MAGCVGRSEGGTIVANWAESSSKKVFVSDARGEAEVESAVIERASECCNRSEGCSFCSSDKGGASSGQNVIEASESLMAQTGEGPGSSAVGDAFSGPQRKLSEALLENVSFPAGSEAHALAAWLSMS